MTVYLSYAQKDEALKQEFEDYLLIWQHSGLISGWVERQVQPKQDWSQIVDPHLFAAQLILLLLSPAFLASGYAHGAEVREAFVRRDQGKARVIPVLLYPVNVQGFLFEAIQHIPRQMPVSSWSERSKAWQSIDWDIRQVINTHFRGR
jgi:hypothetical protein